MEFLDLPDELILKILQEAGHIATAKTAMTCRKLSKLSTDNYLWFMLYTQKFPHSKKA